MLHAHDFQHHDVSAFPVVTIRGSALPEGYAPQWVREMEALVGGGAPFALVLLDSAPHAPDDQREQMLWMKGHKAELAAACRVIVGVEPDEAVRAAKQKQAAGLSVAFGVPMLLAESEATARDLAAGTLAGAASAG